jgi:hypothetical protein
MVKYIICNSPLLLSEDPSLDLPLSLGMDMTETTVGDGEVGVSASGAATSEDVTVGSVW